MIQEPRDFDVSRFRSIIISRNLPVDSPKTLQNEDDKPTSQWSETSCINLISVKTPLRRKRMSRSNCVDHNHNSRRLRSPKIKRTRVKNIGLTVGPYLRKPVE